MLGEQWSIGEIADMLGVSIQTLRRWDADKIFVSQHRPIGGHRFYRTSDLNVAIQQGKFDLVKMARAWVIQDSSWQPFDSVYCSTKDVFQVRLQAFERQLASVNGLTNFFPLISSCVGEIGSNSFDHNLGNWPDVPGIFFGVGLQKRQVVLADRGQGILTTLKRVRPTLKHHTAALEVAFTEILTGRSPEHRGNGLKFVRRIVTQNDFFLQFQTGDAVLQLRKGDKKLTITKVRKPIIGCLVLLSF